VAASKRHAGGEGLASGFVMTHVRLTIACKGFQMPMTRELGRSCKR
jgi:hypothetical protein